MGLKKKDKKEEIAPLKEMKEEIKPTTSNKENEPTGIDLLDMNEPQRDYIYNTRIINELTAVRTAIIELINEVKKE